MAISEDDQFFKTRQKGGLLDAECMTDFPEDFIWDYPDADGYDGKERFQPFDIPFNFADFEASDPHAPIPDDEFHLHGVRRYLELCCRYTGLAEDKAALKRHLDIHFVD